MDAGDLIGSCEVWFASRVDRFPSWEESIGSCEKLMFVDDIFMNFDSDVVDYVWVVKDCKWIWLVVTAQDVKLKRTSGKVHGGLFTSS